MTKKKVKVAYEKRKERPDMAYGIYYVDGSRIEAFGENNFPKNFNEVFSELDDLTVEAKDAFYEEQSS